jgi:hypothetical protein
MKSFWKMERVVPRWCRRPKKMGFDRKVLQEMK